MNSSDSSSKFVCTDLENSTIQKQRKELQLLIAELKDRDKELNDMVFVHQRQLLAWENDRQHVLRLEQKCARLENELQRRNGIIRSITNRIKSLEAQQQDRKTTLANTQQQLQEVCLKASEANNHCQDLEEKNQSLNGSVLELSAQVGRLKAREQELSTLLRLKDKDIIAATNHIAEFTSRFKDLEAALRDSRLRETSAMKEMQGLKPRINGLKTELDKLKAEREKRKDQLLQLAKSKQDRTDRELQNLRQIYMKQQHDLQFLQLTSESSGDKAQKRLDVSCCPSGVKLYSGENDELATNYESPPLCMEDLNMPLMQSTLKDSETLRCQLHWIYVNALTLNHLVHLYSPTNKLQDLLAKSRQMVTDLELGSLFSDPWGNSSKMHITENFLYTDPPGTESREDKWANLDGL
ncbi:coiled-coil domain-containing protein 62 isoform X3 [Hyla sarda]|uniref:coiled-coil domain-containing protein 62 isoform X3 n=1 Tax=Hyla sarda TaxID=327740 RepID=UPI0024C39167|nr:coiled-coil domain-containing protein 62 isoform X3 [Hyla sarda]